MFHVLNRGVGRMQIFDHDAEYAAFERIIEEALRVAPLRICVFCWLPNHWHFILWPPQRLCINIAICTENGHTVAFGRGYYGADIVTFFPR